MEPKKSFEDILTELKNIVNELEKNELPIDQAINAFETGIQLTKQAEIKLQDIKDKVTKIVNDNKTTDFKVDDE
ncbi:MULTISPECIES: exodeoxyribonuclease VII small subunit [Spiroplasma]|uniref:Exodeoxyribonuclease 7 small subunit n=1 Tax=Spiroplasma eriocheiris TaxID=315358 RepID=A0A0H3XJS3_9MOLU|nr:exodeoxyribonuclease VII small subunit [Spiroplasma eriocheiris]AHF57670.1 putative exodeoxyribonuclease VII small subunit [Spiroplasma eriocheiris CCTCC M 207170]AKM54121.1 exodeoxyribonuclease VII small subunit [Spiroplasma eriocheiris]